MTTTRRSVLAAGGASLAWPHIAAATGAAGAPLAETVADIIRSSEEGNAALMQGDIPTYSRFVTFNDDFLLMSPFGGKPTLAADYTPELMASMGRFFRNGSFTQEVLQAYASDDMVVLATIERTNAEVGGLPPQDWALRVTLVYRRVADGWRLAHRHADPLVHGIDLEQAAALGRGALPG